MRTLALCVLILLTGCASGVRVPQEEIERCKAEGGCQLMSAKEMYEFAMEVVAMGCQR